MTSAEKRPLHQIEVFVRETREQCCHCGHYVCFTVYKTTPTLRYVKCPQCAAKHAIYTASNEIRLLVQRR